MKFLIRASLVFMAFISFNVLSDVPEYPMIFCTNEKDRWEGAYTINIAYPNMRSAIVVEVSQHIDAGNIKILRTNITQQLNKTNLKFLGFNFMFNLPWENFNFQKENQVQIKFKLKNSKVIHEEFRCYFAQNTATGKYW